MTEFPRQECGAFHLTPKGWVRKDHAPFPEDRLESWCFEWEQPAEDAKEQVCFTRNWVRAGASETLRDTLRTCFGLPLRPSPERNVTMECDV